MYRPTIGVLFAACAVLLASAVLRCCVLATLYDGDMELFVYMGKLAGQGGRIGIELLDNKLPTVGMLMWLPYKAIGAWWPGYAWLGIGAAAGAVLAIARAAGGVYRTSTWPTAAMAAAWMSFPLAVFSAFKLEHITLLTSSLAAWAFVRCWQHRSARHAMLVGLFAGVGALAKPNALAVLAAAIAAVAVARRSESWRDRVRLIGWMFGGLAVPVGVTLVYLIASGAIAGVRPAYEQIRSYNQNSIWQPQAVLFKGLTVLFLIAIPLLMRGVVERRRRGVTAVNARTFVQFAVIWLTLEVIGIAMQGRMYGYHFLPLTAPAALLFGLMPRRPLAISVFGSAAPVLAASVFWAWTATLATETPVERLTAIDYVKTHAAAGDAVWMDEYARLLVESDLTAGSRVPLTFIFSNDDHAPAYFGGIILDDLRTRCPRWVVLPVDCVARAERLRDRRVEYAERPRRGEGFVEYWGKIESTVQGDYVPVATFGEQCVYERRPALATTAD